MVVVAPVTWTGDGGVDPRQTKGNTYPKRLRMIDQFICGMLPSLLGHSALRPMMDQACAVDLGIGVVPITTTELYTALGGSASKLIGVDQDEGRIAGARKGYMKSGLTYRLGGFRLPMREGERVKLIRAMNLMRQYPQEEAREAVAQLVEQLEPGGVAVVGNCDLWGTFAVAGLHGKDLDGNHVHHGTLFSYDHTATKPRCRTSSFEPQRFREVMPEHLWHSSGTRGGEIDHFLHTWQQEVASLSGPSKPGAASSPSLRGSQFVASARATSKRQIRGIMKNGGWLERGLMFWRHPIGGPEPGAEETGRGHYW